ncbi:hypothetical protein PSTG_08963 [Puccinia striiformis f. sp. tritici PST-78]|uniref:Uncharacterized protein n=1 Tax=Puccinia striiformis f. sp. tritici PST-78 TaxID=1165861 RepID=A0A0L0VFF1_9BASI|nr:hypothetical protein PSTG_08963 [Puccinia striiformis f. sp. tritici PST-78]
MLSPPRLYKNNFVEWAVDSARPRQCDMPAPGRLSRDKSGHPLLQERTKLDRSSHFLKRVHIINCYLAWRLEFGDACLTVTTIYRLPDDMAEDKHSTPADITRLSQISPVKYTGNSVEPEHESISDPATHNPVPSSQGTSTKFSEYPILTGQQTSIAYQTPPASDQTTCEA